MKSNVSWYTYDEHNSTETKELVHRRPHHMPKLIQTKQPKKTTSLDTNTH